MSTTVDRVIYTKIGTNEACVGYESGSTIDQAVPTTTEGEIKIQPKVTIDGDSRTVTMIGKYAFGWCQKLTNIIIPNTVKTLKRSCLDYLCLTEPLILPSSVTKAETWFLANWYSKSMTFLRNKRTRKD